MASPTISRHTHTRARQAANEARKAARLARIDAKIEAYSVREQAKFNARLDRLEEQVREIEEILADLGLQVSEIEANLKDEQS